MNIRYLSLLFLLFAAIAARAQKHGTTHAKNAMPPSTGASEQIDRMIMATQRIMFLDSIVVEKSDFLQAYSLSPEMGRISTFQQFFSTKQQPNGFVFQNALGTQCVFSQEDVDGASQLYVSERQQNKWTRPLPISGIGTEAGITHANYPFMTPDGQTLYFAAKGEGSIGGYDIFVATYDAEEGRFLAPENIGMPFNSEANDYLLVIDEYDSLGWFATDRNQPDGYVCVYTFVPSDTRQTYSPDEYTPQQIANFARIADISQTWDDERLLDDGYARIRLSSRTQYGETKERDFTFVINDKTDYHCLSDFKARGNQERYQQLVSINAKHQTLIRALNKARDYYATAAPEERNELGEEILASEQQQHQQHQEIHLLEKTIRNEENIYLSNIK